MRVGRKSPSSLCRLVHATPLARPRPQGPPATIAASPTPVLVQSRFFCRTWIPPPARVASLVPAAPLVLSARPPRISPALFPVFPALPTHPGASSASSSAASTRRGEAQRGGTENYRSPPDAAPPGTHILQAPHLGSNERAAGNECSWEAPGQYASSHDCCRKSPPLLPGPHSRSLSPRPSSLFSPRLGISAGPRGYQKGISEPSLSPSESEITRDCTGQKPTHEPTPSPPQSSKPTEPEGQTEAVHADLTVDSRVDSQGFEPALFTC